MSDRNTQHEQILQERSVPDPHRRDPGVLRVAAHQRARTRRDHGFGTFTKQLKAADIKTVEMRNRSNELQVTLDDKTQYRVGFAATTAASSPRTLLKAEQDRMIQQFDAKGTHTNGWGCRC